MLRSTAFTALFLAAGSLLADPAAAQDSVASDTARRTLVIVDPFSPLLEGFSGELQHAVSPSIALSVGGSVYPQSQLGYSTVNAKIRLFPQGHAPAGLAVALGVGLAAQHRDNACFSFDAACDAGGTSVLPTVGVALDYMWLLGTARRFALGVGVGLQRVLGVNSSDTIHEFLPMGQFGVGYAF